MFLSKNTKISAAIGNLKWQQTLVDKKVNIISLINHISMSEGML